MASFTDSPSHSIEWSFKQLTPEVRDMLPRGGASLAASEVYGIVVFGGADRGQSHFNDLATMQKNKREWRKRESKGDVPTPRSGHATVCYGKFMFLFGGIDFAEEAAYNDLYVLNLETLEWRYVGEAGNEIAARNSHSLAIISGDHGVNYIVIYGGASPDLGPLGETFYAVMPEMALIDSSEFFLTWHLLSVGREGPGPREMHATCSTPSGSMIISGGRNESGAVLIDVWELHSSAALTPAPSSSSADSSPALLSWKKRSELTLNVPRCSHGAAVICLPQENIPHYCVVGGFTGATGPAAMPDGLVAIAMHSPEAPEKSTPVWSKPQGLKTLGPRFGVSVCNSTSWIADLPSAAPSPTKIPIDDEAASGVLNGELHLDTCSTELRTECNHEEGLAAEEFTGILLFGGVNMDRDFADVWHIGPSGP